MGLSGRKVKQRIPEDPRNLSWADNAARFGSSYLAKFGWDASQGLGASGDGRTSHIKVSQKLDMLGIGAAHQKDPNGIAWKQNKEFENLLKRLNAVSEEEQTSTQAENVIPEESNEPAQTEGENIKSEKEKKKRKHGKDGDEQDEKGSKKKRKTRDGETLTVRTEPAQIKELTPPAPRPNVLRHRAHRARAIAAKNIASKSATAISEILGIAPSTSSSALSSGVGTPSGMLTSMYDDDDDDDEMQMDKITTSTKSVADYFKEKLLSKSSSRSGYSTPTLSVVKECEVDYVPRGGLGSSRVRFEVQEMTEVDTKRTGLGLPKFSCLMSSSLPAAASSITAEPVSDIRQSLSEESILIPARNSLEDDESDRIAKKKETKERKEKRKEKKKEKEGEIVKDKREEEKKERRPKIKDGESRSKKSKVDVKNGDEELESRRSSPRDTEKTSAAANEKAERRRQKQEKKEKRAQKRNSEVSE